MSATLPSVKSDLLFDRQAAWERVDAARHDTALQREALRDYYALDRLYRSLG